jgi:acyl-CoA synthetase (AMP-forming)/AMP-acid ligase II/acyl carrier protein
VQPAEIPGLDLHRWSVALNGSERVQADTLDRFARTFSAAGFRRQAFLPCYGLAEASLMVSAGPRGGLVAGVAVASEDLRSGRVVVANGDQVSTTLVPCGAVTAGQDVMIVDAETAVPAGAGEVGEIWVSGPCVGRGYWRRPEETTRAFHAHPAGGATSTYLRTGDLGFFYERQLVVVGRLKDLIIVRGVNYVPEDIERTVSDAHPDLRPGCAAAFAVDGEDGEQLVVVQELRADHGDTAAIIARIRTMVVAAHGLQVASIVLVRPKTLPKTSSGKMQRSECRTRFVGGALDVIVQWAVRGPNHDTGAEARGEAEDQGDRSGTVRRIEDWLIARIAALRDLPSDQIDTEAPFSRYGMDSAEAAILAVDLEDWLHMPLSSELVWNRPTIASLAEAVADELAVAGDTR